MNNDFGLFKKTHVFLPVIHVVTAIQTVRNVFLARDCGADGVFLINHQVSYQTLLEIYQWVKRDLPDFWVGLNFLDLSRGQIVDLVPKEVLSGLQGLWVDEMGIDEDLHYPAIGAFTFKGARSAAGFSGLCFGGTAFKGQKVVADLPRVTQLAKSFAEVLTTSGSCTGKPPTVGKIKAMKEVLGDRPLAIASGITAENVFDYKPYANCFLVASSVEMVDQPDELDPIKVRRLAEVIAS